MTQMLIYTITADISNAEIYLQSIQRRMIFGETFDEQSVHDEAMKLVRIDLVAKISEVKK